LHHQKRFGIRFQKIQICKSQAKGSPPVKKKELLGFKQNPFNLNSTASKDLKNVVFVLIDYPPVAKTWPASPIQVLQGGAYRQMPLATVRLSFWQHYLLPEQRTGRLRSLWHAS
jgi:hypothetical protein